MDVHPPHEPVHTWRDALVHLGIVTVGLFIALMLEGVVEYFHHRELVHHARENIRQEIEDNHQAAQYDLQQVDPNSVRVKANIAALRKIEADPKSQPAMSYKVNFVQLSSTAWQSARDTGALGYMPYEEVQRDAALYGAQERANSDLVALYRRESESLGPVISSDDYREVAAPDLQSAIHENGVALVDLYNLKQLLQSLDAAYVKTLKTQ